VEPDRWPLIADVINHLTALNPDVPDFQPGKIWKNENQSMKNRIHFFRKNKLIILIRQYRNKNQ
jgi:hypothetical protein